jgi:hypothetical protein
MFFPGSDKAFLPFRGALRQPEDPAKGNRGKKPETEAATERDLKARFPDTSSLLRRPVLSFPFQKDFPLSHETRP